MVWTVTKIKSKEIYVIVEIGKAEKYIVMLQIVKFSVVLVNYT